MNLFDRFRADLLSPRGVVLKSILALNVIYGLIEVLAGQTLIGHANFATAVIIAYTIYRVGQANR